MKTWAHYCRPRWFPLGLSLLMGVQSLLAFDPENNYWIQRRAARGSAHSPPVIFPKDLQARYFSVIEKIPRAQAVQQSLVATYSTERFAREVEPYTNLLKFLSEKYGTVRKISPPFVQGNAPSIKKISSGLDPPSRPNSNPSKIIGDPPPGPTVILIQDVHQNTEAQNNIRGVLSDLLRSGRVGILGLEGSTEELQLQRYTDFHPPDAVRQVADYLLKENQITGPIHAALTTPGRLPRITGIDDPVHYKAHVQSVRESSGRAASVIQSLKIYREEMDARKTSVYSPELLSLDKIIEDYQEGKISLGAYVESLAKKVNVRFPSIQQFRRALECEKHLDFLDVEKDKTKLIEKLLTKMTDPEIESLAAAGVAYRSGSLRFGDFFSGLAQLCKNKGVSLSEYPAMNEYIRYVLLADGIDPEKLLHELTLLEKSAYSVLAKTSSERELVLQSRRWTLSRRLVEFAFTPAEWEEWQALEKDNGLDLSTFESFYREARFRDEAMAENILGAFQEGKVGVLVAGGFHAQGITPLLQRKGAAVISFVPKISRVDTLEGSGYLSVFCQEKTPLEKLFKGERLFLGVNPLRPEIRRVALPILVILATLALGFQVDPPSVFKSLEGMGAIQNVLTSNGMAQAVLAVGLASMVFSARRLNGSLTFSQTARKPKLSAVIKIKFLDPIREQASYFFPMAILFPALAATAINATFGGGLAVFLGVFALTGTIGLKGTVNLFLTKTHPGYSAENISALHFYALSYGLATLLGFLLSVLLMAPSGMEWIANPDLFLGWSPLHHLEAIGMGTVVGNLVGLGMHVVHNIKTFPNYSAWRTGGVRNTLLPLSSTAAAEKLHGKPKFATFQVDLLGKTRDEILTQANHFYWDQRGKKNYKEKFAAISEFKAFLGEFNPRFIQEYGDLTDVDRLASDDFLLRRVIHLSVFCPLNASTIDFPKEGNLYMDIDPESWAGLKYLGEEIWWANGIGDFGSHVSQGIGLLSPEREKENTKTFLNFLRPYKLTQKQLGRPENIIADYERLIIENMLKGYARTRIFFSDRKISDAPNSNQILYAISKVNLVADQIPTTFSKTRADVSAKDGPAFIYAGARLASMIEVFQQMMNNGNHERALYFIFYRLHLIYETQEPATTAISILKQMFSGLGYSTSQWVAIKKPPRERCQIILSTLKMIYRRYFYSLDVPLPLKPADLISLDEPRKEEKPALKAILEESETPPELPPVDVESLIEEYGSDGSIVNLIERIIAIGHAQKIKDILPRKVGDAINELDSLSSLENISLQNVADIIKSANKLKSAIQEESETSEIDRLIERSRSRLVDLIQERPNQIEELILKFGNEVGLDETGKQAVYFYMTERKLGLPDIGKFNADQIEVFNNVRVFFNNEHIFPTYVRRMADEELVPVDVEDLRPQEFLIAIPNSFGKLIVNSDESLKNKRYLINAILKVIQEIRSAERSNAPLILKSTRTDLGNHRIRKVPGAQYVFAQIMKDNRTLVVLWMGARSDAHDGYKTNKKLDQRLVQMVDGREADRYSTYRLMGEDLTPLNEEHNYGELKAKSERRPNSLFYLMTGNPWWGLTGAGIESVFLLFMAQWVGVGAMSFIVLPLFSLAHVWVTAQQTPNLSIGQITRTFFWHYILAVPYALVGASGFQDLAGNETASNAFAAAWHFLTDSLLIYQDHRRAVKAARQTLRILSPPTPSLRVEEILGARSGWATHVKPFINRAEFEKDFLRELNHLLALEPKGIFPNNPVSVLRLLESRLSGIEMTDDIERVHLQIVGETDVDQAVRSAQILKEWKSMGLPTPRLIIGAKNKGVLDRLRNEALSGTVDVLDQPVVQESGKLETRLLLESLRKIRFPRSYRMAVTLSQNIILDPEDIDQLPNEDLADILREGLLNLLKGDFIGPKEFRLYLEVAQRILENA